MSLRGKPEYYHSVLKHIPPRPEPAFESSEMMERVWGRDWGCHDDVGVLTDIVLHRPGDENLVMTDEHYDPEIEALIDRDAQWYFRSDRAPDLALMQSQHDGLAQALRDNGVNVHYSGGSPLNPKAVFMRDTAIAVPGGAIICRMGPVGREHGTGRRGEEAYITRTLAELGVPILRTIHGTGLFEGGSFSFLDSKNAAVGMSYRQNEEAVRQIEEVLSVMGVRVHRVPLVGHSLHIDGAIVMIAKDLALVRVTRLPYWLFDLLDELGIRTIEAHPEDNEKVVNSLAIAPGKVLMCSGTERTTAALEKAGVEVIHLEYDEIHKSGGGIHCSTMPLRRERA